jgi:hypothetical protein
MQSTSSSSPASAKMKAPGDTACRHHPCGMCTPTNRAQTIAHRFMHKGICASIVRPHAGRGKCRPGESGSLTRAVFALMFSFWNEVLLLDASNVNAMPAARPTAPYCEPTSTACCTQADLRCVLSSSPDIMHVLWRSNRHLIAF